MNRTLSAGAIVLLLLCHYPPAAGQTIPKEALRHFDRGCAAVELAKSPSDYQAAIQEFEEAAKFAPSWPDIYYNLGLVQEEIGAYDAAIKSYRKYLQLSPQAGDAVQVRSRINRLEFRLERTAKQEQVPALLEGEWKGHLPFCGGVRYGLRFYNWGKGQASVELPVTWNANPGVATDYQRIEAKIDGEKVSFAFRAKMIVPNIVTSYCDVRFELKVVGSQSLEGAIFQDGSLFNDNIVLKKQ